MVNFQESVNSGPYICSQGYSWKQYVEEMYKVGHCDHGL